MKVLQAVLRSGHIKPGELDALALMQPDLVLVFGACALLAALADSLKTIFARAVLLLGQGVQVNGSALILGLTEQLGSDILVTGGLAGDAAAFTPTWVLNSQGAHTDSLVCLGLYGQSVRISHGTFGGWSPFGPARKVTRCQNNVLFELDDEPALGVCRRYLGEYASGLPASGLLFPFAMLGSDHAEIRLIRTMDRVEEGVDAVRQTPGARAVLKGLYSNGDISPLTGGSECRLHNQTMTLTLITEI